MLCFTNGVVWYGMAWYGMVCVWYGMVWHGMYEMRWDGEWDWIGYDEMRWDGMELHGMRWNEIG